MHRTKPRSFLKIAPFAQAGLKEKALLVKSVLAFALSLDGIANKFAVSVFIHAGSLHPKS